MQGGDDDDAVEKKMRVCLVWEDLTVVARQDHSGGSKRKLLNGLNGYAESNRMMAVVGPSGSGKSTLIGALAGD